MNRSIHRPRALSIAVSAILPLLLVACCGEAPIGDQGSICCSDTADPTFLRSKIDDDDGDGIFNDVDFPSTNDEDDDIADHAWIQSDDGMYHLFFQTEDHGSGSFIEHYVSIDLQSLSYVGPALRANPNGWDSHSLWAPHIVRNWNMYFMFYTGTDGPAGDPRTIQRIGLAVSSDLTHWTRCPVNRCRGTSGDGCIYECAECWTMWDDTTGSFNRQCRDPFVLWDSANRRWVMFATAKSLNGYGVVTVAYSTDCVDWSGAGFIDATRRLDAGTGGQTTGGQAENPFTMEHNGVYYLLFTDWWDPEDSDTTSNPRTIVQYATSRTLTASGSGSVNWIYRGYIPDPGVNAIEVLQVGNGVSIMSQSIANAHFASYDRRRRQLRLRCITWGPDFTFDTSNVDFYCGPRRSVDNYPTRPQ